MDFQVDWKCILAYEETVHLEIGMSTGAAVNLGAVNHKQPKIFAGKGVILTTLTQSSHATTDGIVYVQSLAYEGSGGIFNNPLTGN